jgi:ectoine hydroxylase-related dioxygenase (phytanoyl-CoA dioxygenase family)
MSVVFSELISDGLGSAAAEIYAEHGITCVRGLIPADEIATIRKEFTDHVESHENLVWKIYDRVVDENIAPDDILKRYPRYSMPHRHLDMVAGQLARRYITDPRIFDIAENLIGATWAAQSMFYFKPPTARGQALHQDNFFLQAHPETCLAAWVAVDDADAENGALQVVPGSHQYDIACPEDADPKLSFSAQGLRIPTSFNRVQSEMKAGDVLFFHGSLIHGSLPNTSKDRFRRVSQDPMRLVSN